MGIPSNAFLYDVPSGHLSVLPEDEVIHTSNLIFPTGFDPKKQINQMVVKSHIHEAMATARDSNQFIGFRWVFSFGMVVQKPRFFFLVILSLGGNSTLVWLCMKSSACDVPPRVARVVSKSCSKVRSLEVESSLYPISSFLDDAPFGDEEFVPLSLFYGCVSRGIDHKSEFFAWLYVQQLDRIHNGVCGYAVFGEEDIVVGVNYPDTWTHGECCSQFDSSGLLPALTMKGV
ncbi:hypothetical protein U1Q18_010146 [Sarracenia purpurea var. burkii]